MDKLLRETRMEEWMTKRPTNHDSDFPCSKTRHSGGALVPSTFMGLQGVYEEDPLSERC